MAQTGSTTFSPVLHNITPERVVFVYNTNVAGSRDVALAYQDLREIPDENIIGLSIALPIPGSTSSDPEAALSKSEYLSTIENPLKTAIQNINLISGSQLGLAIWVIILGYGIPLSFEDDNGEIIAIASRLHRLGKTDEQKFPNHTFDRRGSFKFFDEIDASEILITAIIDGPTVDAALSLINRAKDLDNQTFVTGEIFIDPYGLKITDAQIEYQSSISDCIDNELPNLGLIVNKTTDINDPYKEPTISSFFRDTFYWGWFNPTFSKNLFFNQNQRRAFLYNADNSSASNIHYYDSENDSPFDINGSDPWCNLAINITPGYALCAGSVAGSDIDTEEDAYLRPRPFFATLHQGATIGEAFLFASQYVNWKTVLIGDPLTVINFPLGLPPDQDANYNLISNHEAILRVKESFEESLAWAHRQSRLTKSTVDTVISSKNLSEEIYMLLPTVKWRDAKSAISQNNLFSSPVEEWMRYIMRTTGLTLENWLIKNNYSITHLLNNVIKESASSTVIESLEYPEGQWEYKFVYSHELLTFENIHFDIRMSRNDDFTDIVFDIRSIDDILGWKYESEKNIFVQMPDSGFPSNFSGRRVKFISPIDMHLNRTDIFYIQWRAVNKNGAKIFPINSDYFNDSNTFIISR